MRHIACCFFILIAARLRGAEALPGHSSHGEAFDEGPRQAAVLIEGCGKVNFPVATNSTEAQKFFNQGVGQLHGFWYFEAERSFRQVAKIDPECAMAYWGCAMANANNEKRASGFIKKASDLKAKASKQDQMWIDALAEFYRDTKIEKKTRQINFIKQTEDIVHEFPDSLEPKAFLAWSIWHAKEDGVPMVSRETVDALLRQVFAKEPMHPAHHYIIHLWDDSKPSRAVDSATKCGQAAPAIAHMWHMPGHTFSKVNRQDDAAWQQEAATRVDHAYMIRTQVLPDQIHNYAHNTEWLIRTLNILGREHEAESLARNLVEIPRHPAFNGIDQGSKSAGFGRTRLLETLLKFELWDSVLALEGSPYLDVTQNPALETARMRALGAAAFFKGDANRLQAQITSLSDLKEKQAQKPSRTPAKSGTTKQENGPKPAIQIDNTLNELNLLSAIISGNTTEAAKLIALPRDIPRERLVRYHLKLGNKDKAAELAGQLPSDAPGQALRIDVLAQCGRKDDAVKAMKSLSKTAGDMDADLPATRRLDALSTEFAVHDAWRGKHTVGKNSGVRPPLESLGPLLWHPWHASSFTLPDEAGHKVSLSNYRGRPVLVLFYLGNVCGHCMEQLKAFAAAAEEFEKEGISIVAIGSEDAAQLPTTRSTCGAEGTKSMTLLADPSWKTFREWRCHDDFEDMGLHGAFLIDARGMVRWADVSYEPFKDTRFLLGESKRLLGFDVRQDAH